MNSKTVMALLSALLCLALLASGLWAESPQLCSVRGVVSAAAEQPLENARVQLKSAVDASRFSNVITDARDGTGVAAETLES